MIVTEPAPDRIREPLVRVVPPRDAVTSNRSKPAPSAAPDALPLFVAWPVAPARTPVYFLPYDRSWPRAWREWYRARRYELRRDRFRQFNETDMAERKQRVLSAHAKALAEGTAHLRAGRYRHAMIALTLAAELNQGDPACRVHLAQAQVALGHDAEAAKTLRRALQLQPLLAELPLNLARQYPHPEVLDEDTTALARRLAARTPTAEELFLLGFFEFQREDYAAAHDAISAGGGGVARG